MEYSAVRMLCYRACWPWQQWDDHCYNLMIKLGGWSSIGIGIIEYYVPEDRSFLLILSHPELERRENQDYII